MEHIYNFFKNINSFLKDLSVASKIKSTVFTKTKTINSDDIENLFEKSYLLYNNELNVDNIIKQILKKNEKELLEILEDKLENEEQLKTKCTNIFEAMQKVYKNNEKLYLLITFYLVNPNICRRSNCLKKCRKENPKIFEIFTNGVDEELKKNIILNFLKIINKTNKEKICKGNTLLETQQISRLYLKTYKIEKENFDFFCEITRKIDYNFGKSDKEFFAINLLHNWFYLFYNNNNDLNNCFNNDNKLLHIKESLKNFKINSGAMFIPKDIDSIEIFHMLVKFYAFFNFSEEKIDLNLCKKIESDLKQIHQILNEKRGLMKKDINEKIMSLFEIVSKKNQEKMNENKNISIEKNKNEENLDKQFNDPMEINNTSLFSTNKGKNNRTSILIQKFENRSNDLIQNNIKKKQNIPSSNRLSVLDLVQKFNTLSEEQEKLITLKNNYPKLLKKTKNSSHKMRTL